MSTISDIRKIINEYWNMEISKNKGNPLNHHKKIRLKIFNCYFDFCERLGISPLSISSSQVFSFFQIQITSWRNAAPYDIAYAIQYLYNLLQKFKLSNSSTAEEVNQAIRIVLRRKHEFKRYKYQSIISAYTARDFLSQLKKTESKIIFYLYKSGLNRKEILELKLNQIDSSIGCFVLPLRTHGMTIYQERVKKWRLLKYESKTEELIREYLKTFELELEDHQDSDRKLFEEKPKALFSELNEAAKSFGFVSGNYFLTELRNLILIRMHRRNVPIPIIMDFMNISKMNVYMVERNQSILDEVDHDATFRSLNETWNL